MTRTIKIRKSWASLKRNRVTSSVRWDVGGFDNQRETSDRLRDLLEEDGFVQRVIKIAIAGQEPGRKLWWITGCARWGWVRNVDHKTADRILDEVVNAFTRAMDKLEGNWEMAHTE